MTAKTDSKLELVAPIFPVKGVRSAVDYYVDRLMFSVSFEWADEEGAPLSYAILRNGNCELHLSLSTQGNKAAGYFFVRAVEAYHGTVAAKGATITQALKDWPWQMREFEVTDPDGNRLIFGEALSRIDAQP